MQLVSLDALETQIQRGKKAGLLGALQIGDALKKIKEGNLWMITGAKSFFSYAAGAHGLSKSSVYNVMSISTNFGQMLIDDPSLQGVDVTRLIRLLPHVTPDNADELLHQAAMIPDAQGFDANLRNLQHKIAPDQCEIHDFQPVNIQQCKICGLRRKG